MMTIALARVGRIKRCGTTRSDADPIQRVAGQTNARNQRRDDGEKNSGGRATHGPHPHELGSPARCESALRQMADRLAAQGVSRLNAKRVERPEIRLGDPKQRSPAEPADEDDREQHEPRADAIQFQDSGKNVPDPCRRDKRRETQDRRRQHDRRDPREQEFRQADLGEEAARRSPEATSASGSKRRPRRLPHADRGSASRDPTGVVRPELSARERNVGRSHGVRQQDFQVVEAA